MKRLVACLFLLTLPLAAQQYKMAVIGLVHSHVWGHLPTMLKGEHVQLVGIAESNPELVAEAKRRGAGSVRFFDDYKKMLDETKPDLVWSFVENNRHLEIVATCAPRKINVIFEKPLAATYKEAVEIRKLAQQHEIRVMTNYQMAWWPANYAAHAAAKAGELGQVWRLHGIVGHGGPGSTGVASKYFFEWLTDPVKNGAGALMDFGCYNALWSLWYLGRPESVFAQVNHLRPETFPKVEDNATLILHYKNGVGLFEGSWDLPRGFQDLEVFGLKGSLYLQNGKLELRKGKETKDLPLEALPPDQAEPIAYMVSAIRNHKPVEGLTALDINVQVVEIIEAAKQSVKTGRAIPLK
ncbi:MAG TPA: Gfo/Idh/MocA family oxidoreductase [Bryobacteraceae bacterium]|jgi:predicted dehydrogenase|nr:Gfo/Idh/MocA family oxidoreductase [Bryobacteraceae bacterium]